MVRYSRGDDMTHRTKRMFYVIGTLIVIQLVVFVIAYFWQRTEAFPFGFHMFGGTMMPFGMIGMGLFWAIVIYFAYTSIDRINHHNSDNALLLLKKRLANGEISVQEYDALMKKIKENE